MFTNEYTMNRKRFDRWTTPKFWRNWPGFFVYLFLFAAGAFGWIYFKYAGAPLRWQTIGAFLTFIAVYRGVFFNWMRADKMFRLTRQQYFNDRDWDCRVRIGEKKITLSINGKLNNTVDWSEVLKFEESKTYYRLATDEYRDGVMLDKASFTEGDADSFRQWMAETHPDIPYAPVHPMWDF